MSKNINIEKHMAELRPGEKMEWTAVPEPFQVVEPYNRKALRIRWILTPVIAIILLAAYIIYCSTAPGAMFSIIIPIIIVAAALFFIIRPFTDARTLSKKRTYIVTDKRVIVCEGDTSYKSMDLEDVDKVKFIDKGDGVGDVIWGESLIKKHYSRIRVSAIVGLEENDGTHSSINGLVFYNVKDYRSIKPLLAAGTKVIENKIASEMK